MVDSITRLRWHSARWASPIGEPPTARGYTPSVFATLPRLLERAGTAECGSITGLYTVLVEGDDMNEPIADAARSILDGHCVLTRELAHRNHYPAIDVLASVSRLVTEIVTPEVQAAGALLRETLALLTSNEDLIAIGAYARGTNPRIDAAIALQPQLERFLRQGLGETADALASDAALIELMAPAV